MLEQLSLLDFIIFFSILALTFTAVVIGRSKKPASKRSVIDILLDGRRLTLPFFVATLVATWYGGIFGVTQIAYEDGIYNLITQGVFWYISYIIFAFFLVPKIRNSSAITLPEIARKRFGHRAEKVAAAFNILNIIPTTYVLSIGIFLDVLFGCGIIFGSIIGTAAVLCYSFIGGFRSVVLSDLIQFSVMVLSVFCVFAFSISTYGGWDFLKSNLPATHFNVTGGYPVNTLIMWGMIALSTLVDPNFYHRVFAAKTSSVARKGILLSICVWIPFDIATTAGGMYAAAVLPEAESMSAYVFYALDILPAGLKGFFLAGILATLFSTIDGYLFLAASTVSYDLQKKKSRFFWSYRKNLVIFAIFAIFLAAIFSLEDYQGAQGIKYIWKTFGSYSAGCLLLPFLWTLLGYSKKFHEGYFLTSTIASAICISIWKYLQYKWQNDYAILSLEELYIGMICSAAIIIASLILPQSKHQTGTSKQNT